MLTLEIIFMLWVLFLLSIAFIALIICIRKECREFDEWLENEEARQYGTNDTHDGEQ